MSPEQAQGKKTDERTDIWSLGVVLYEMLSGKLPFEGKTTNHTIVSILEDEPKQVEGIPNALQRIVRKTLTKDRGNRYQVARDLLIDLNNLKHELEVQGEIERLVVPGTAGGIDTEGAGFRTEHATRITNPSSLEYVLTGAKSHKPAVAVACLLLLGLISAGVYFAFFAAVARQIDSVAVMPFVNDSGDQENEYLSDGMTETLIHSLSKIPGLSVKARSSVFLYKGKKVSPKKIGEELNVQAVLSGRVVQRGEDLSLSLELVDAQTETILWSEKYDRKMSDLVSLQSEIAREVSDKTRFPLTTAERERVASSYTMNSQAQKLYMQGRFHRQKRNRKELEKAIEYFELAVKVDPEYALAYSGLADSYGSISAIGGARPSEYMPLAKKAALKAVELGNDIAETHIVLAQILFYYDYDWKGAEREYKLAIELDPKNAYAHRWYSHLLATKGMHDEAIREISKALELEPSSIEFKLKLGDAFLYARRYDEAIKQYKEIIAQNPGNFAATNGLAICYELVGMYSEAAESFFFYFIKNKDPERFRILREAYAKGGWAGYQRSWIESKFNARRMRLEKDPSAYIPSIVIAWDYSVLKDREKTLEYLNKAYEERDLYMVSLNVAYLFDFLRDDPRFRELVKKVGIPDQEGSS
jgi:TolB-like protein/tetratricopeptide (TPR) repeat protein